MLRQKRKPMTSLNTRALFMYAFIAADTFIVSAVSSFTACVPNASMPEKRKISAITVTAHDSKKQISHNTKNTPSRSCRVGVFCFPRRSPFIKAIAERKTVLTEELMFTDSFFVKVAYEKDIAKVIEKSRQCIQNISKRYFVKM